MSAIVKSFNNIPSFTQSLLAVNIGFSVLVYIVKRDYVNSNPKQVVLSSLIVPVFELVPNTALKYFWTLTLASFIETSLIPGLFLQILNTLFCIAYFEKIWGIKETFKFLFIVSTGTNLLTCVILILLNKSTSNSVSGVFSLLAGYLVAFKQIVPEHNINLFKGAFSIRVKNIPFIFIIFTIVASCLLGKYYPALNTVLSFYISWIYLRFFQCFVLEPFIPMTNQEASSSNHPVGVQRVTGDASDTFTFASFFPEALQKPLILISNVTYQVFCKSGLLVSFNEEDIIQSNERAIKRASGTISRVREGTVGGSIESGITERRRQIALQAIDERISTD